MTPKFERSLQAFVQQKRMPSMDAFIGYLHKIGPNRVAAESGLELVDLQAFLERDTTPSWLISTVSPEGYATGLTLGNATTTEAPSVFDLRPDTESEFPQDYQIPVPPVDSNWDQMRAPTCGGWATSVAISATIERVDGIGTELANPCFIYSCAQRIAGNQTHGTTLPLLAEAVETNGAISWDDGPLYHEVSDDNPGALPIAEECLERGEINRTQAAHWLPDWSSPATAAIKAVLSGRYEASPNWPLPIVTGTPIFDASCFNSFTKSTGIVLDPPPDDTRLGGHAIAIVGWKHIDDQLYWIAKNSWGPDFGDQGFLYFPDYYAQKYFFGGFVTPTLLRECDSETNPSVSIHTRMSGQLVAALAAVGIAIALLNLPSLSNALGSFASIADVKSSLHKRGEASAQEEHENHQAEEPRLPSKRNEEPPPRDSKEMDPIKGYLEIVKRIDLKLTE